MFMNRLNPDKLSVTFLPGTTPMRPFIPRLYTLTHSDETANLYLSIGMKYSYSQITSDRDEVLAKWSEEKGRYFFYVYVHVDSQPVKDITDSIRRYTIFKKELPLALEAIHFGDQVLFFLYPWLNFSTICIHFKSVYPPLCKIEYWKTLANY
jgi:hypothetical protein